MPNKTKTYSIETKLKAVKMYLEESIGNTMIAKELEISADKRVLLRIKRFREFGEARLEEQRGKYKDANKGRSRRQDLTLEQKNEKLRAEVEYLKKIAANRKVVIKTKLEQPGCLYGVLGLLGIAILSFLCMDARKDERLIREKKKSGREPRLL